jgi:hypothetical protein
MKKKKERNKQEEKGNKKGKNTGRPSRQGTPTSSLSLSSPAQISPPPLALAALPAAGERRTSAGGRAPADVRPGGPHGPPSAAVRGWPSASGRVCARSIDYLPNYCSQCLKVPFSDWIDGRWLRSLVRAGS